MHAETNYIYIVFAVLYVIYSIVKAVRKKAEPKPVVKKPEPTSTVQPPTASPIPKPGDDFKKMLEDLMGGAPEIEIPEKQLPQTKPHPLIVKPQPTKIVTHAKKEKAVVSHMPSKTQKTQNPFLTAEQGISKKVFTEITVVEEEPEIDFDLRQAIIYSEILKRPQY